MTTWSRRRGLTRSTAEKVCSTIHARDARAGATRNVPADDAWEEWILYILNGVTRTSTETVKRIEAIGQLQADFAQQARAASRGGSDAELLAVLFEQPYARIATVIDRCGVSRPTATRWLADLADAGLVDDRKVGRDRLFVNQQFLDVLLAPY